MTLVLAFDCAISGMSLAVVRDGTGLARHAAPGRDQAARLFPAIEALLSEAKVDRRDIALLAVTVGPGSFTGVRVGLSAARGLALALRVPLAGLATTEVLQAQAKTPGRVVVAAIDSKLGDWFVAIDGPPLLVGTEALRERLKGQAVTLVGPEADGLAGALGGDVVALQALPDAAVLAALALDKGVDHWRRRNAEEGLPRPLYLRGVNVTSPDGGRHTVEA
jgi:tRNA threonylcarbamoyladenosine biosynthesis protein TsaB